MSIFQLKDVHLQRSVEKTTEHPHISPNTPPGCVRTIYKMETDVVLHYMTRPPRSPDQNRVESRWFRDELDCKELLERMQKVFNAAVKTKRSIEEPSYKTPCSCGRPAWRPASVCSTDQGKARAALVFCISLNPMRGLSDKNIRYGQGRGGEAEDSEHQSLYPRSNR